jgi:hypothetical protein
MAEVVAACGGQPEGSKDAQIARIQFDLSNAGIFVKKDHMPH